ncbi:hypothetical protein Tco_0803839 [Tanacetum coccineum]|uniref:Uncharacterized protein n=1 Tax=Tanacetum coccineum TaxID=301880 RepID=A0ABQ5A5H6_9ASTR
MKISTKVPTADMIVMMSMIELKCLFSILFDEYLNGENQVVLKSSAIPTADASDKCQQQPDSTSSTSNLATTVTADGNFDFSQAVNKSPMHYPCDSAITFMVMLFSIHSDEWKSFQSQHQTALRLIPAESDSSPHAHAQTIKTYYWHQDSRIKKAQVYTKTKTSANSDIKDSSSETKLRGEIIRELSR